MRATSIRPAKGFWGRSYDELKRLSGIAMRAEAIKGPSGPYRLVSFDEPGSIADCKLMTDDEIGGFSTAALDWVAGKPAGPDGPSLSSLSSSSSSSSSPSSSSSSAGYLRFRGCISTRLPAGRPDIQRTGYAAWRTADRPATVFGRALWDVDSYAYLALRVRSDGRSYLVNVQTDSMVAPTDLHQHRLFARRPGRWETVVVPWADFVRTNHGFVVEPQTELLRQKVRSVGLGLTDRVPGPFELCVAGLWATNDPHEAGGEDALAALASSPATRHAEQAADDAAAAAAAARRHAAREQSAATAAIPFAPLAASAPAAAPPPPSEPLKDKSGRSVRWDTDDPPQRAQSH